MCRHYAEMRVHQRPVWPNRGVGRVKGDRSKQHVREDSAFCGWHFEVGRVEGDQHARFVYEHERVPWWYLGLGRDLFVLTFYHYCRATHKTHQQKSHSKERWTAPNPATAAISGQCNSAMSSSRWKLCSLY